MPFAMIDGSGNPNGEDFARATEALYSLSYAVKMSYKSEDVPEGYYEDTVFRPRAFGICWIAANLRPIGVIGIYPHDPPTRLLKRGSIQVLSGTHEKGKAEPLPRQNPVWASGRWIVLSNDAHREL
mgnify:CR=1 FL=1